ncbi:uncharacterized protein LOC131956163 [Physella acuta]|uniref:uncharacterized protein LOC131956163 n=1 Tax=Physella acuta TaxID=109671 RepID=UPI0027DBB5A9|nr:uncharacterized protein LOC131956163 [Physella acuta]
MSRLLLVHGFEKGTNHDELLHHLQSLFPEDSIQNLWLDPFKQPRAVAEFERIIDDDKLLSYRKKKSFKLKGHCMFVEIEFTTSSMIAKTSATVKIGAKDKLSMLFSSKRNGGKKVANITELVLNCFEVTFIEGWDAVQAVCQCPWQVEGIQINVCPYFKSFKEPFQEQHHRLQLQEETFITLIQSSRPTSSLPSQSATAALTQSPTKTVQKVQKKKSTVFFDNAILPLLLHYFNFDEEVTKYCDDLTVEIDIDEKEANIEGTPDVMKSVHQMLSKEDNKVDLEFPEKDFFSNKKIQNEIKTMIEESEVTIILSGTKPELFVKDKKDKEVPFYKFFTSLFVRRECTSLPSKDFPEKEKLKQFVEKFNSDHSNCQIYMKDVSVTLLSLASNTEDLDSTVNHINNKIKSAVNPHVAPKFNPSFGLSATNDAINRTQMPNTRTSTLNPEKKSVPSLNTTVETPPVSSGSSQYNQTREPLPSDKSSSLKIKRRKVTVVCQHQFYVWLLDVLDFIHAVTRVLSRIKVTVIKNDCEVLIHGEHSEVDKVKTLVTTEDGWISMNASEENFLAEDKVQQYLKFHVKEMGYHIVVDVDADDDDTLEMWVEDKDYRKASFQDFVMQLVVKRKCFATPSKDFLQSLEWISYKDSFNHKPPGCYHISDTEDSVTLLSLADFSGDQSIDDVLASVNNVITAKDKEKTETSHRSSHTNIYPDQAAENISQKSSLSSNEDNSRDSQLSVSITSSASSSGSKGKRAKLTIICQNHFYVCLLKWLDLRTSVMDRFDGLMFEIKEEEDEVVIKGYSDDSKMVKVLVTEHDRKLRFTDLEENYLSDERVLQYIKSSVADMKISIIVNNNKDLVMLVSDSQGNKVSFVDFMQSLLIKKECQPLPSVEFRNNPEWTSLIKKLQQSQPLFYISVEGRKVTILTAVKDNLDELKSLMKNLNKTVESFSITTKINKRSLPLQKSENLTKSKSGVDQRDAQNSGSPLISQGWVFTDEAQGSGSTLVNAKTGTLDKRTFNPLVDTNPSGDFSFDHFSLSELYTITIHHSSYSEITSSDERRVYKKISSNSNKQNSKLHTNEEKFIFPVNQQVYNYCKMFLRNYFKEISEKLNEKTEIIFAHGSIEIKCRTEETQRFVLNKVQDIVKSISYQDLIIKKPGLPQFLESPEGLQLIESISEHTKCFLEFPEKMSESWQRDLRNPDYKVAIIGTAVCQGFNLHLVLGNIRDMEQVMKVEFKPSKEAKEFSIKLQGTSKHLVIMVPDDETEPKKLAESLKKQLLLVFEQAKYISNVYLAFSMELISDPESPVPFRAIAEIIISEIWGIFQSEDFHDEGENQQYQMFICEPSNKHVFDIFDSLMKDKFKTKFESPDQICWDSISPTDLRKYADYNTMGVSVEVSTIDREATAEETLYCYPILPGLDTQTCPILLEPSCSKQKLDLELREFQRSIPGGILVGDSLQVGCLGVGKDALLYCCSEWGADSEMAIHDCLEMCAFSSSKYEEVHIIPPGFHVNPKYPKLFLAQKVFESLDILLKDKEEFRKKHIVFVIDDKDYHRAFENELLKRCVKRKKENSSDSATEQRDSASLSTEDAVVSNDVISHTVSFWGQSHDLMHKASSMFEEKLDHLMSLKTTELHVKKDKIGSVEKIIKSRNDWPVLLTLEKPVNPTSASSSKHERASLNVQGLNHNVVQQFINQELLFLTTQCYNKKGNKKDSKFKNPPQQKDPDQFSRRKRDKKTSNTRTPSLGDKQPAKFESQASSGDLIPPFQWMYEITDHTNKSSYQYFEPEVSIILEQAYTQEQRKNVEINIGGFTKANFNDMSVVVDDEKAGILRSEVISEDKTITLPRDWIKINNENWATCQLMYECIDYQTLVNGLLNNLAPQKVNFLCVERVQNKRLYQRFKTKCTQMKHDKVNYLWHRAREGCKYLICEYGFHPVFSGMQKAKYLGDGVLFYEHPKDCFGPQDFTRDETVSLFYSQVLQGRSGSARPGQSSPSGDKHTNQAVDSASSNGQVMIFSDAQAYPEFLITLRVKQM